MRGKQKLNVHALVAHVSPLSLSLSLSHYLYTYMYVYLHNLHLYMYRYTPLMEAAREGHEDVVQLLVEHGANVNAQTEETQETALTLACCGGFMEVVQYLTDHGE